MNPQKESVSCEGCSIAVDALIEVVHLGVDFNTIATILTDVCPLVMNGEVCRGAIHNFKVCIKEQGNVAALANLKSGFI